MEFKAFLESEEKKNIESMLKKIPKPHRCLIKGFKYKFQSGNTMKGDDENIGSCDCHKKEIVVAAPWNYGREFTILHEVGHMVWETLKPKQQKAWEKVVKGTKGKHQHQKIEELFCMAYANTYANHKDKIHDHPEWEQFIKSL